MFLNLVRKYHLLSFDRSNKVNSPKKETNISNNNKIKLSKKNEKINFKNDNLKTTIISARPSITELNDTQLYDSKVVDKIKDNNKNKQIKMTNFINYFNSFERLKKKYISLLTNNNLIKNKIKNCIYSPTSTKKKNNLVISFYTNGFYDISEAPIYLSISIEFFLYLKNKRNKENYNDYNNTNKLTSIPIFLDKIINTNLDKKIYDKLFHSSVALRRIEYSLKEKENYIEKHYCLKIIFLQRYWRYFFYNKVYKKIILIQSVFRSFILRKKIFKFLNFISPFLKQLYENMNKFLTRLKIIRNINKKKKKFRTFKSPKNKNISISIIEIPKENDITLEEEKEVFQNINEESNEYTKSNHDEFTQSNQDEFTKSNQDEFNKSNQDEFNKSNQDEFNKSNQDEFNESNQNELNKSNQNELNKSNQNEFIKSKHEDFNKSKHEDFNKSKHEDFNKSNHEEFNKLNQDEYLNKKNLNTKLKKKKEVNQNISNLNLNLNSSKESFDNSQTSNKKSNKDYNLEMTYKHKTSNVSIQNPDMIKLKPIIHWEFYTKIITIKKENEKSLTHIQLNSELTEDAKWRIFILFLSNFFVQKTQREIFNMIFNKNQNNKLKTSKTLHYPTINNLNNNDVDLNLDNLQYKEQHNSDLNEGRNFNKYNIVLNSINEN